MRLAVSGAGEAWSSPSAAGRLGSGRRSDSSVDNARAGRRRRRPLTWALSALSALFTVSSAACVEFVGIEEPGLPDLTARVVVNVVLDGGAPATCEECGGADDVLAGAIHVTGAFFPGTDREGWPRSISTDRLAVADTSLTPIYLDGENWYHYSGNWAVPAAGEEGVDVSFQLPVPDAVPGAKMAIRWRAPGRVGTGRIEVGDSREVELHISNGHGVSSPQPAFQRWQLELTGGGPLVVLSSVGQPPPVLLIPRVWLPANTGTVRARLVTDQLVEISSPEADYHATAQLRAELRWLLVVPETEAAP